ncbi:unnamed protein product [Lactuca saligna]|uniref:TF-B3 domain-containing protein n=1 Tax=Lactuca saligna TaxID=75948 RepID=A0AA36E1E9_LACSI|nr:unnamed protein product [Lactuca saligna]
MMAEDTTGTRRYCKRVYLHAAMGQQESEDIYYLHKILKLVVEKMNLIDVLPKKAVEERKRFKSSPTVEKNKKVEIVKNQITQELEEFITNKLKGKEAKVVIQKTLYKSDLEKNQNRLSMPMKQVIKPDEFLRKNEKEDLEKGKEFEVKLLGPRLEMHKKPMMLKMWHMNSTSNYVLKTEWNRFVKANKKDLEINKKIQVWSFRIDEKLCFAIACFDRDVDGQNDAAATPII